MNYKKLTILKFRILGLILIPSFCSATASSVQGPAFRNWGIDNTVGDSHIHAVDAWKLSEGNAKVVVAIIDTGIDATHPDIKDNLWHDKKTGIWGWDTTTNTANPNDEHSHGTHIAGIIGGALNHETGTSGVAHHVSLMPVKYYKENATGPENLKHSVEALLWAIKHGARIINYSGGGPEYSKEEYQALLLARRLGILVVAAAGNEQQDVDEKINAYYPCSYQLDNIICVTAITIRNLKLASASWGKKRVNVFAPGELILSTLPGGKYGYKSGSSQATAFVTGVSVLLLSKYPDLKPKDIINIIDKSVDPLADIGDEVSSGGKINTHSALVLASKLRFRHITQGTKLAAPPVAVLQPLSKIETLIQEYTKPGFY